MEATTGERIVAFGRVGKRPENPFFPAFQPLARSPSIAENRSQCATVFKAGKRKACVQGITDMALGTKKRETRKSSRYFNNILFLL